MFTTPRLAKSMTITTILAGLVPYLQSSPGVGKSSIVKEIADDYDLQLIDIRLSQIDPTELNGFPTIKEGIASYAPMSIFPLEGAKLPEGKKGWLLFLDEMSSAPPAVQAAAYKLVLDRMVGQSKLHKKVAIVAAGNLITDRAVVAQLSTALQSRVVHIMLEPSLSDFKEWAFKKGISSSVLAFLNYKPDYLHKFDPDSDDHTFACPRTWEFASMLEAQFNGDLPDYINILMQGVLGNGVGTEYATFLTMQKDMVTYEEVVANPKHCRIPSELSTQWAVLGHLVAKIDIKDLPTILTYVQRMPIEFTTMFIKDLTQKHKDVVRSSKEINEWILNNSHRLA